MGANFGFDLRSLEVFARVAETGNMTAAAERLGMTQSSISQTLSNLESNLNTELMDRSVRPMELTTAGRFLYDRSMSLLKEALKTNQAIQHADFTQLQHVKIALVDSIATAVGKNLIEAVKKRTRDWSVSTGLSHQHGHALLSRNADIIISDDALEDYPGLSRRLILREPFILALPNSYKGNVTDLQRLQSELDFIRYSENSLIGQTIERYLRRIELEPPQRLQLDNSFAIVSSVSSGMGWTLTTPLCLFQTGIKLHQVQCLPLPGKPLHRTITLVARRDELGDLPKKIASDSIDILRNKFLSEIGVELPWLLEQIEVGE